ncbi:MAG: heme-binding domain-containing protein [Anaerolineae bacterium]|nr:heme-binding domain-containing protein [Anaerolineae bacterium]
MSKIKFVFVGVFVIASGLLLILWLMPNPINPPVQRQLAWDSPQTKQLWDRACNDCHSNTTYWPIYAKLPIVSNIIVDHVNEGRKEFNISVPTRKSANNLSNEIEKEILKNKMPLTDYTWLHPAARLSDAEKKALIDGMKITLQNSR